MSDPRRHNEAGIALVLALLSLMLLTFLGLTMAVTTSTELQIATNYRWSQQAFYNAEAGLEVAKKVLAGVNWSTVLPTARPTTKYWTGTTSPVAADKPTNPSGTGSSSRDYENWQCDQAALGTGYGRVLVGGGTVYADMSSVYAQNLNGTFTIWVRRPLFVQLGTGADSGDYKDVASDDQIILTVEGVAPFTSSQLGSVRAQANRAVRTMEMTVSRVTTTETCGTRGGQVGGSEGGAGFGGCAPVSAASLGTALGQATPIEDTAVR